MLHWFVMTNTIRPVILSVSAPPMEIVSNKSSAEWTSVTHCKRQEKSFFLSEWITDSEWLNEQLKSAHSKTIMPICFVPEWILSELAEWFQNYKKKKKIVTPYCCNYVKSRNWHKLRACSNNHICKKYTTHDPTKDKWIGKWMGKFTIYWAFCLFCFLVDTQCAS